MSVSYSSSIYSKDRLFFLKLLFRWAGSVWQLLWMDYVFFVLAYIVLAFIYHKLLADHKHRQITFEAVVRWISLIRTSVPLSFMLGFFVASVLSRWWSMCMSIPWMHAPAFFSQSIIESSHAKKADIARKIRITVLRYFNLAWILMMAAISLHIKERFGFFRKEHNSRQFKLTWQRRLQLINSDSKVQKYFGQLITDEEMKAFAKSAELSKDNDLTYTPEYWLPLAWATRMMRRAINIGCIADERQYLWMVSVAQSFRNDLGVVWTYSEFSFPLVYTQVAVAAVYIFLFSTLLSTQLVESDILKLSSSKTTTLQYDSVNNITEEVDSVPTIGGVQVLCFIPILGSLEFIFYLGWFKIGICLLNPLGRDKADLPLSEILNCNLKVSVKLGGAEDSLYPLGLTDNGEPEEQQVAEFLRTFDFNGVHAHDSFGTAEENEAHLSRALIKRLQGTGKDLVNTLGLLPLTGEKRAQKKAAAARRRQLKGLVAPSVSERASMEPDTSHFDALMQNLDGESSNAAVKIVEPNDAKPSRSESLPLLQPPDA